MDTLESTMRKKRSRWFGHVQHMEGERLPKQVLTWNPPGGKRKRGCPRKNWVDTMHKDLEDMKITWEEAEEAAREWTIWKSCVPRCAVGTGRT